MAEPPVTRVTLLARIRDGRDADAWREFVQIYGPVVYRFARNRGLQDADAADLMQDVLRSVARNAPKLEYDPARGTFRGWLYTVTRNKIYNFLNGQRHRPKGTGDTDAHERLDATPARDGNGPEAEWEREYQRRLSGRESARSSSPGSCGGTRDTRRPRSGSGARGSRRQCVPIEHTS